MSRIPENNSGSNGFSARESTYEESIARFFDICYEAAGVIELRAPRTAEGTAFGFFSDHSALARVAVSMSGHAPGIYATVNCVNQALLSRCSNHTMIQNARVGVCRDEDIERLTTLLVDVDPVRPKDTSATNEEHGHAFDMALAVTAFLKEEHGWPDPVVIDSGNGIHLRYRIDLANTPENVGLLHSVLISLSKRFSDGRVKVDTVTYNPSRVAKIPFTMAAKGEATSERPHRMATILSLPEHPETVTIEQLASAAIPEPEPARPQPRQQERSAPASDRIGFALKKDNKFFRLWHGDTSGHGEDDSRADEALCAKLAYWLGGPYEELIDQEFRRSALMRPKWDERRPEGTYGSITIRAALKKQTRFYEARETQTGEQHTDGQPVEEEAPAEKPRPRIFTYKNVPDVWDLEAHISWIVEGLVFEHGVSLITGDSGHGKTIFATALAGHIVWGRPFLGREVKQRKVLYMDRENPLSIVKQHLFDLKIPRTSDLIIWGGWCDYSPDSPAAGSLIQFAREEQPVMIWDSLIAFHTGDEQSASDTRKYLQLYRRLAAEGASLIVLHHTGKSENSKQYRGSSDIKANVDVAWVLEKLGDPAALLKDMRLVPFKDRIQGATALPLVFQDGEFLTAHERPESSLEALERIVAANPGESIRGLINLAKMVGIAKHRVEDLLKKGAMGGCFEVRKVGPQKSGYFIRETEVDL